MADERSAARPRPPWWMWIVAAPFVLYCALAYFVHLAGPEDPGFGWFNEELPSRQEQAWRIGEVEPGTAGQRAGLEKGDLLLSWEGGPSEGRDLFGALLRAEVGRPRRVEVERDGERLVLTLTLERQSWTSWPRRWVFLRLTLVLTSALWLTLGLLVLWSRPDQAPARWGALFMGAMAVALVRFSEIGSGAGFLHYVALLPRPIWRLAELGPFLTGTISMTVLLVLVASFPTRLQLSRWIWALFWLPSAILIPPFIYGYYLGGSIPMILTAVTRSVCWFVAISILVWNYRRLTDLNHRRRVRLVSLGLGISLVTYIPFNAIFTMAFVNPEYWRLWARFSATPLPLLVRLAGVAAPLCVAYAIVRHRVFDIHVMIRQGLQYAVARGLLLGAAPALVLVLVVDAVFHGDQPLRSILADRGWLYVVLAVGAALAHRARDTWMTALDRRFFRERYDAQAILRGVLDDVRNTGAVADLADRVVSRIEKALHPECVALLTRGTTDAAFQVAAHSPAEASPPPLAAESKLAAMLRLLGKPLEIPRTGSGDNWIGRQLPEADTDYLRRARFEWLFPIAVGSGASEGLLALGSKRSEEPYSREDQDLLATIATSLALVLERPAVEVATDAGLLLANRYRLGRMLGRGGMGAAYEALDVELDRRVAVKLMHPELTKSPEAVARFKREAQSAAAFTHPNVVTVHDFGVAADHGAFLVMELLSGMSLRDGLQSAGRLPDSRSIEILRGITAAVEAAHKRHLIHRDLKPENVFLTRVDDVEVPKVLDFGVAKTIGVEATASLLGTSPGHLLGTPRYMSPEQLQGDDPNVSWDVWALAIMAYELLAGAYPFPIDSAERWRRAVQEGSPAPIRTYWKDAPAGMDQFFQSALAPTAAKRPSSARQLFDELKSILGQ